MTFDIENKVALVSGGVSGIGFAVTKELLRSGLKGVTLADVDDSLGREAIEEIEKAFGPNKAIYVKTDVANMESFEYAFEKTVNIFKHVDILINNAGIFDDLSWERGLAVNLNGVIHGILLGFENYIHKHKSGEEGVIVNISSITSLEPFISSPFYSTAKFAVNGLTRSFGHEVHFKRTKVKVLALCPGVTETPLSAKLAGKYLNHHYEELSRSKFDTHNLPVQTSESVALALVKIVKDAKSGTVWVSEGGQEPYEYVFPPRESFAPKK